LKLSYFFISGFLVICEEQTKVPLIGIYFKVYHLLMVP